RAWLAACRRVLKPNGTIWVSGTSHVIHSVGFAMQQLGFKLLNDISWVKPNPPPNLSCRYFTHATETIIWAAKSAKSRHTFNYARMKEINGGRQMKSVWEIFPPAKDEKRFGKHPAQKPIALLERILLAASNEGDLVLDPFLGGGTTLITALRLHRQALGCELDIASVTLAMRRICSDLIQVHISVSCVHISLDPPSRSVDRSNSNAAAMSAQFKFVHEEVRFYFIGQSKREVIFTTLAASLEDAHHKFLASGKSESDALFIVKTAIEIYLT
ncbi:MAG: site-specific DNA-methyltransferase, partial [Candidatus Acidiferrales bacterium]